MDKEYTFNNEYKKIEQEAEKRFLIKAKNHKYKYINPLALKNIIGKWAPVSLWNFSYLLECFIGAMNEDGISIMNSKGAYQTDIPCVPEALKGIGDKLLRSNRKYKKGSWKLYKGLDFDITHNCIKGQSVETMVKPYFAFPEFRRNAEDVRVVVHATVAQFEGTSWTISFPLQYIMQGYPKIKDQYFGYCHKIALFNDDGGHMGRSSVFRIFNHAFHQINW